MFQFFPISSISVASGPASVCPPPLLAVPSASAARGGVWPCSIHMRLTGHVIPLDFSPLIPPSCGWDHINCRDGRSLPEVLLTPLHSAPTHVSPLPKPRLPPSLTASDICDVAMVLLRSFTSHILSFGGLNPRSPPHHDRMCPQREHTHRVIQALMCTTRPCFYHVGTADATIVLRSVSHVIGNALSAH